MCFLLASVAILLLPVVISLFVGFFNLLLWPCSPLLPIGFVLLFSAENILCWLRLFITANRLFLCFCFFGYSLYPFVPSLTIQAVLADSIADVSSALLSAARCAMVDQSAAAVLQFQQLSFHVF
ncbi:hypothetical protein AVEN_108441-1 [Araneus ventricosus]|uniref:Uncharacterized protein n=1 Tax=Araneus ventricosus TaxID=182803 RepID=A0A4Y2V1J6_ARAVE|nr:hypothetical protein AVEN_108441-1 [Araneus ventricosus]